MLFPLGIYYERPPVLPGPQISEAVADAERILKEILKQNFHDFSERANMELEEAQQLLESMKEFQVPVKEDIGQLETLRNNMTLIRDRLAELQNQSSQSLRKVSSAMDTINKMK